MSKSIRPSASVQVAAQLQAALDALDAVGNAESRIGAIAYLRLAERVKDAIAALKMDDLREELAASLPAISGGSPDDSWETIDPSFLADPAGWPGVAMMPEVDGFLGDFDGLTPLYVLGRDVEEEIERSAQDWDDLFRASYGDSITDYDLIAAGLAVG